MRKAITLGDVENVIKNYEKFLEGFDKLKKECPNATKLDSTEKLMMFDIMMKG